MKTPRPEKLVVVIGRNRRVYARVYKLEKYIPAFVDHCYEKEQYKAMHEGFSPYSCIRERVNDTTLIYHIDYWPLPDEVFQKIVAAKDAGCKGRFLGFVPERRVSCE